MIQIIDEETAKSRVSPESAFTAIRAVFSAMAKGSAHNFPVIREALKEQAALFGFKSGYDQTNGLLGLKAGGYWSNNTTSGLDNHQSSVLLFEPESGQLKAVVSGNYLTAIRTAAASAVSIDTLARTDASTLSIVGAGKQAEYQVRAALPHRSFSRIFIANRTTEHAARLTKSLSDTNIAIETVDHETAVREAHVLISIVSTHAPQVRKEWVMPGTHIAAMGTDTKGKQELDAAIPPISLCFADHVAQSISIGELQHAINDELIHKDQVTAIGDVINGNCTGRTNDQQITLFDGTGVGLQDLAAAALALQS